MTTLFKAGDPVVIRAGDDAVRGVVRLASDNGRSLVIEFDAIVAGYIGVMPLLYQPGDDDYHDLFFGRPITLERMQ